MQSGLKVFQLSILLPVAIPTDDPGEKVAFYGVDYQINSGKTSLIL